MPYSTTLPGVREATVDALMTLATGAISDLNAALTRDAQTPLPTPIAASMFHLGEPDALPSVSTQPVIVYYVGGGKQDGTDLESTLEFIDPAPTRGIKNVVHTSVTVGIHPELYTATGDDAFAQAAKRERLLFRLEDWLRTDVYNKGANLAVALGSREYSVAPNYDTLIYSWCRRVRVGWLQKSFAGSRYMLCAEFAHEGWVV